MTENRSKPAARSLGDLLEAYRRRTFVGREHALAEAEALLAGQVDSPYLFFHGPGGIGKTTLLQRVHQLAVRRGVPVIQLDGRLLTPAPQALRDALETPLRALGRRGPALVLLDTCEYLEPVLGWLYNELLPGLDPRVRVIAAGRVAPEGVPAVALDELSDAQARHYLAGREVPPDHAERILAYTGGHPLALAMACDLTGRDNAWPPAPDTSEITTELARRMLREATDAPQSRALRAAALVRAISPGLLSRMLPDDDGPALFDWLAGLSCIEAGSDSLIMHDIARAAIAGDFRERAPQLHELLCRRAEDHYREQLSGADAAAALRAVQEVSFLSRDLPMMRSMLELIAQSSAYPDAPHPGDVEILANRIEHFQGTAQRRCFEYWQARQPGGLTVFREARGEPAGCALVLAVEGLDDADTSNDTIVDAYRRRVRQLGLSTGSQASLIRFWLDAEQHLAPSAVQAHTLSLTVAVAAAQPSTAFMGLLESDAPATRAMAELAGHEILEVSPSHLGDTPVVITLHDWRQESVLDWLIRTNRSARM
ncbi:MAG: hypothetical protein U5R46_17705 [Gammaproteobacteria bacterium]|nr:hypothetical protein [Gammaproteobacteria bacterium]